MNNQPINKFLRKVRLTEAEEISCSECFERVSGYVERSSMGIQLPEDESLRQHLLECDACREEAEALMEVFQLGEIENMASHND